MLLYHGTSRAALPAILQDGIKPRGKKGKSNWKHSVESNPNCVYLTEGYGLYFAINAGKDLTDLAIVEVDTDRLSFVDLLPDEDAIEQVSRGHDDLPKNWDMVRRTRHYRRRMVDYGGKWPTSIKALGTCCHYGTLPTSAITRVATLDLTGNMPLRFACDPTISTANYAIMGGYYRQLTAHIFGDAINYDDIGLLSYSNNLTNMPRNGVTVETMERIAA